MTIEEVRRENARLLAAQAGGDTKFAEILNMDASQVSQLIGKTIHKNIGKKIARRIEEAFKKPEGWLDSPHFENATSETPALVAVSSQAHPEITVSAEELMELSSYYLQNTPAGRQAIMTLARTGAQLADSRRVKTNGDEG